MRIFCWQQSIAKRWLSRFPQLPAQLREKTYPLSAFLLMQALPLDDQGIDLVL